MHWNISLDNISKCVYVYNFHNISYNKTPQAISTAFNID